MTRHQLSPSRPWNSPPLNLSSPIRRKDRRKSRSASLSQKIGTGQSGWMEILANNQFRRRRRWNPGRPSLKVHQTDVRLSSIFLGAASHLQYGTIMLHGSRLAMISTSSKKISRNHWQSIVQRLFETRPRHLARNRHLNSRQMMCSPGTWGWSFHALRIRHKLILGLGTPMRLRRSR